MLPLEEGLGDIRQVDPLLEPGQALEGADLHPEVVEIQEQPAGEANQLVVDGAPGGLDKPEKVGTDQELGISLPDSTRKAGRLQAPGTWTPGRHRSRWPSVSPAAPKANPTSRTGW